MGAWGRYLSGMTPTRYLPLLTLLALLPASPALAECQPFNFHVDCISPSPEPIFREVDQEFRLRKLEAQTRAHADYLADEETRIRRMEETLDAMRKPYRRF